MSASGVRLYTPADLEGMATIKPISTSGGKKKRMGCPFHGSDHQRSLEVNLAAGRYNCYSCDAWGYLAEGQNQDRPASDQRPNERPRRHWRSLQTTRSQKFAAQSPNHTSQPAPAAPQAPSSQSKAAAAKIARWLKAAQGHLMDQACLAYLQARHIPLELAQSYGLGYFPAGKWPGRSICRQVGRIGFPLYLPPGELVGIASRAIDPDYPRRKIPKEIRFDTWGRRGIFNPDALKGPAIYLCESPIYALCMIAAEFPTAAALVGTKGLRWEWLSRVQELYTCWDLDDEGLEAARALAQQAVVHGTRVYVPGRETYNGYSEPSEQWEREGRVTLRVCCGLPVYPPTAERCPNCQAPMCPECNGCDTSCPSESPDMPDQIPDAHLTLSDPSRGAPEDTTRRSVVCTSLSMDGALRE